MPSATETATNRPRIPSKSIKNVDQSPTSSPLQPSSRNGNIMTNETERTARGKSNKFGDIALAPSLPSSLAHGASGTGGPVRKVSALQAQAQHHAAQAAAASGGAGAGRKGPRLSTVVQPLPIASMEVMTNNFEEWMKLATDNKITVTNTWNFALIDYFADLTLLRNGPDDQSINFQKASCTLDGCVKIWTSRVDSVATETGKLLSGLAGGGADEEREEGEEGEDEEGGETKTARKNHRSEATLAKSFAPLQLKKFDLEFTVDPLFKKTCADFDEGGAMGLLMNHLGVDGRGRVVFDAGDAGVENDEEEEEGRAMVEEEELVDLSKLREFIPSSDITSELNISDTLAAFKFSSDPDDMPDFSTLVGITSSADDELHDTSYHGGGGEVDFFGDDDYGAGGAGDGGVDFDDGISMAGDDEHSHGMGYGMTVGGGGIGMAASGEGHGPFDPRRAGQHDLVMALVGGQGEGDEEGMFDYFDKGFGGKGWAGVEHWKLRKVSRKVDTSAPAPAKVSKTVKQPFTIDFSSSTPSIPSKQLFAPATKASLMLASSSRPSSSRASSVGAGGRRTSKRSLTNSNDAKKRKEEWLLPDDMHFSSRQLLRLFLKPKFSLRMRRDAAVRIAENPNGEIDENFWAQAAADRAEGEGCGDGMDASTPNPFESQFFHDVDDDAFVDDNLQAVDGDDDYDLPTAEGGHTGEEDDLWQGTQGQTLKKTKPENVHFAKKAKRVDVKRLKDDIWSGLKVLVPGDSAESAEESDTPQTPTADPGPPKTFDKVIQNLRKTYPKDKMSEISTSFCFICLLHLANEEGLRIETARFDDGGDSGMMGLVGESEGEAGGEGWQGGGVGEKSDRIVGELQALKVYKDPNAGRAA